VHQESGGKIKEGYLSKLTIATEMIEGSLDSANTLVCLEHFHVVVSTSSVSAQPTKPSKTGEKAIADVF